MTEAAGSKENARNAFSDLRERQLANVLRDEASSQPELSPLLTEAAARMDRADRLQKLLGLLAPAGTAPRTALEQIYIQSADSDEESPIVLDLRHMLSEHWAEWTPALREAEGIPPAED